MRFIMFAVFGSLVHLLVSCLFGVLVFLFAGTAFNTNEYAWIVRVFIFLLKMWNFPVCLYDYLARNAQGDGYWVSLTFGNMEVAHSVLFWGWVMTFGCFVAFFLRRRESKGF